MTIDAPRTVVRTKSIRPWSKVVNATRSKKSLAVRRWPLLNDLRVRSVILLGAILIVFGIVEPFISPSYSYALGNAGSLLTPISQPMAAKLKLDAKNQVYSFNQGYSPMSGEDIQTSGSQVTASASVDPGNGISVNDPVNKIDFSMQPKFGLGAGRQDGNRVIYPLGNGQGWAVYSMHSIGVKEDILLTKSASDRQAFDFHLSLKAGLAARLEADGSVGVYGNPLLSGSVSTGSASDAALLARARQNAPKNTLLFRIPKPTVKEMGQASSNVKASYLLKGSDLKIEVSGLTRAHYPLTIDPSVYVVTAQQFMNGNNETNIDFDVADKLIEKGKTTGARFDSWTSTTNLPNAVWQQGTVAAGGFMYSVGGKLGTGSTNSSSVSWAQLDTSSGALDSPNPGNGSCSNWCSDSAYNLPAARSSFSLVAYNRFLYAIGGEDSSCTSANGTGDSGVCKTVYVAKLGANGEPQLWSPSSSDRSTWTYWYRDADLTSPRSFTSAVAYNNRLYLLGGKTSTSGTVSIASSAQVADITATGILGSWSSQTNLPYADYGYGAQVYNGRLYLIGGASSVSGAPLSTVYYNNINDDGTLNSWVATTSLGGGRFTEGGNFTTSWGGYVYLSGGCSAKNASGYCTAVASDTQLASINADGSLDTWDTNAAVADGRIGHNILAWRYNIYEIGGCSAQNTSTGNCTTALNTIKYGTINQDGDISSVTQSVASGTAPCSGASAYNCDLPPLGTSAGQQGQLFAVTAIINGYLYVAGGCTIANCTRTAKNTSYVAIDSNGNLAAPATCGSNTRVGAWCVDSSHTINPGNNGAGNTGLAAGASAVFDNILYFVGGINGSGNDGEIYYVSTNDDGSLSSGGWTHETLTTAGADSVSYDAAFTRANPSSAGTSPGSLYILGGCTATSNAACNSYTNAVYKCDIATSGAVSGCSTSGQLQLPTVSGASGSGLAGMGLSVYANYVYLMGGQAPGVDALDSVYYAKIDNSNNIVAVSGSAWTLSGNHISTARSFASAFGFNGYLYVVGGYDSSSSGASNTVEFAKINVSDGSIGSFVTSDSTISAVWGMGLPVSGSYAYVLGGCSSGSPPSSCSSIEGAVQNFQAYNNDTGSPASYATAANTYGTSPNRIGASATILNGYLYVAGGCTSTSDCTTAVSTVSYAPIDANGALGSWSNTTAALPAVRTWGKLEAAGGSLYYIGGQDSTATNEQSTVYYGTPSSGNVSSWGTATNGLPAARTKFGSAVWNNRLYVVGGLDGSAADTTTVYVSPQLNSGGNITAAWSTTSSGFSVSRSGLSVVAYANNLYIFGGFDGSNYLSDAQYAQIISDPGQSDDGNVGSWTYSTSLPQPISQADSFAANGYIYLVGGRSDATTCQSSTLVAPISANTTIASGNHPTGIGQWFQTNQKYSGNRYGNSAVYSDGKAYVIGGACGSTLSYASPVIQQTALLSQPQVAQYSIMIDADLDVYPNAWLLNGLDNSIGARWQLNYRSMTNPFNTDPSTACTYPLMSTWGQNTSFGDVTLGSLGPYTPKNGSGTDTNCARYFYFDVTVDSSEAFGYPDDVTRGPTITDLTLQYTANAGTRLLHGRTFSGGLQMPDDTPYYTH